MEEEEKSLASSLEEEESLSKIEDPEVLKKKEAKWKVLDKAVRDGKTDDEMVEIEEHFETRWLEENSAADEKEHERVDRINSSLSSLQKAEKRNTILAGEDVLAKARMYENLL